MVFEYILQHVIAYKALMSVVPLALHHTLTKSIRQLSGGCRGLQRTDHFQRVIHSLLVLSDDVLTQKWQVVLVALVTLNRSTVL